MRVIFRPERIFSGRKITSLFLSYLLRLIPSSFATFFFSLKEKEKVNLKKFLFRIGLWCKIAQSYLFYFHFCLFARMRIPGFINQHPIKLFLWGKMRIERNRMSTSMEWWWHAWIPAGCIPEFSHFPFGPRLLLKWISLKWNRIVNSSGSFSFLPRFPCCTVALKACSVIEKKWFQELIDFLPFFFFFGRFQSVPLVSLIQWRTEWAPKENHLEDFSLSLVLFLFFRLDNPSESIVVLFHRFFPSPFTSNNCCCLAHLNVIKRTFFPLSVSLLVFVVWKKKTMGMKKWLAPSRYRLTGIVSIRARLLLLLVADALYHHLRQVLLMHQQQLAFVPTLLLHWHLISS